MKKILIYAIVAVAGVFSVFSCVQPLDPGLKGGTGAYNLDLSVSCLEPATKAYEGYPAGETERNENKIDYVDWFIFRDTTEGKPWLSRRFSPENSIADGSAEEFFVARVDMDRYLEQYPDGKGYVLTVANYPAEEGHAVFDDRTFNEIRHMAYVTSELKTKLGVADRTKKFENLSNFVMTSGAVAFELSEQTAHSVTVCTKLSRHLSKISLNINVVPYIDEMLALTAGLDTSSVKYIQTWYPDVKNIRAYLTYANAEGTLTPVTTETDRDSVATYRDSTFFTYNSYGFIPDVTYRNNNTNDTAYVAGTPFYSYPMRWETSDAHAPFIKIILAWKPVDESEQLGHVIRDVEHNFMNHTTGGKNRGTMDSVVTHSFPSDVATGNQKFYYKIAIPSENNYLRSNVWTQIFLDVALLGGKEEETSVDVAGRYFVVDWSDPDVAAGGNLTAGTYLSLATARDTFYIYGGNSIEIPVQSSHELEVYYNSQNTTDRYNPTATYPIYKTATATTGSLNYSTSSASGDNYTIKTEGRSKVVLTHELVSDLNSVASRDIATITYNFRIQHKDNANYHKDITVIQYPSLYIETVEPGNAFLDGRGQNVSTLNYGYLSFNGTAVMYHVHITSFNGDSRYYTPKRQGVSPDVRYEYLITDPRESPSWDNIDPYSLNANGTNTRDWPDETVQNMKVGTPTPNFIAPSFLVSSRYGRPGNSSSLLTTQEIAEKRCATYQEAGYPAGRWRLPTEAEVFFLYSLQKSSLITELYTSTGYGYWTSSGYAFGREGNMEFRIPSQNLVGGSRAASVRCVYDTWYWGDEPVTPIDVYHPGPTN